MALDLFSGIGGLTLALEPWVRPVAYCESDRYAQRVLLSRMWDGSLPTAPVWDDVQTLSGASLAGRVDIIYGGFPCQDISVAGAGAGLGGERSGLVFEVFRLIDELSPTFVFLENVPAIRTRGAERVVKELANRGYDTRWGCLSAAEVGASHIRNRWWLLAADAQRSQLWHKQGRSRGTYRPGASVPRHDGASVPRHDGASRDLAHTEFPGLEGHERSTGQSEIAQLGFDGPSNFTPSYWAAEPDVGRVAHGVPARVDRLRGLGNAVVPLQAREAFKRLMGLKEKA